MKPYIPSKDPNNQMNNIIGSDNINNKYNSNYFPVNIKGPFEGAVVPFYDGIEPITQTQSQVAQLEIKYAGPLTRYSMVEKIEDLVNPNKFPINLNYQHRRVWVKEFGCEYYLDNGDGTRLEHWKRAIGRLVIHTWSPYENYQAGDVVNYFGKLYVVKQDIIVPTEEKVDADGNVVIDSNGKPVLVYKPEFDTINNQYVNCPLNNENLWQVITGEIETYIWHFPNTNQIQIYTEIRNPRFEVCLGEIALDKNNEVIYNSETGLPIYKNIEIVEACIRQGKLNFKTGEVTQNINDLDDGKGNETEDADPTQGGVPYVIQLFTDEEITEDKTYYDTEIIDKNKLPKTTRTKFNIVISIK